MKTRTSPPPVDVSQSTSSYPIAGSVRSSNSPSFTGTAKPARPKKWAAEPIYYFLLLLLIEANSSRNRGPLEGP